MNTEKLTNKININNKIILFAIVIVFSILLIFYLTQKNKSKLKIIPKNVLSSFEIKTKYWDFHDSTDSYTGYIYNKDYNWTIKSLTFRLTYSGSSKFKDYKTVVHVAPLSTGSFDFDVFDKQKPTDLKLISAQGIKN